MNATLAPQRRHQTKRMTGFPTPTMTRRQPAPDQVTRPLATHDFLVPNARPDLATDALMLRMLERP
jgi:hypothetical protein